MSIFRCIYQFLRFAYNISELAIAMLNPVSLGSSTLKITCDHYLRLLADSTAIEQELSSFAATISRTLVSLALRDVGYRQGMSQLREVGEAARGMMDRTRERLQRECLSITEVTNCVRKMSLQFRQMIELMRSQQERSTQKIAEITAHIRNKEAEIARCETALQNQKNKITEQAWRKKHYANIEGPLSEEIAGATYLKILKDLKNKLEMQANSERREERAFSASIMAKLKEMKSKLIRLWHLLPFHLTKSLRNSPSVCQSQQEMRREISQLQRRYIAKEAQVDGFAVQQLGEIKKKLKLLQEAEMSESRQQLGYSISMGQHNMAESEVVQLLHS